MLVLQLAAWISKGSVLFVFYQKKQSVLPAGQLHGQSQGYVACVVVCQPR